MSFKDETPVDSPGFLIWRVHNLWQKKIKAMLKPLDITHVQFVLLSGIVTMQLEDDVITQAKLAKLTKTDVMMVSVVLRKLEEKKLLRRMPHPTDPRANVLSLTSKGVILSQKAIAAVEAFEDAFFCDFDRKGLAHFTAEMHLLLEQEEREILDSEALDRQFLEPKSEFNFTKKV